MVRGGQGAALRQVGVLFDLGTTGGMTDAQLLDAFRSRVGDRAEPSFRALVERHGPMVLRTCRSILHDHQAVEDSFQATFLVLVRRARSLWVRDSLGPWLYQVAVRVAGSARADQQRRRRHEQRKAERTETSVFDRTCDDIGPVIHEELAMLPEKFRAAVVLCCLEGLSQQQAAGQLGWPLGTLQSRLARGRERLRARLLRRGLAPSVGFLAGVMSADGAKAAIPVSLANATIRSAVQSATGNSAVAGSTLTTATLLTRGVLKTMFWHKLRIALGAALALTLTTAGALVWAEQVLSAASPSPLEDQVTVVAEPDPGIDDTPEAEPEFFMEAAGDDELDEDQKAESGESGKVINEPLGDGKPDGKKSIGGSGEMIELGMPSGATKVAGVKIHGSRYGQAQPPRESFLIYFMNKDRKRILHTEMAPYSLFKRGPESWVEIKFESPVEGLPKTFWLVVDFRAAQTKGVYVSYDTTTAGKFSRVGLPGLASSPVDFGGDWMIQGIFTD
jgi:RNA polymerase sigma factor (sigma-70 family)